MVRKRKRLLIVGIDGGTFRIIRPLVEQGELPNIKRIMEQGVARGLNSTIPTITPVAWTSSITGMRPENHNVFDFYYHAGGDYYMEVATINSSHRRAPAFWEILSDLGYRVNIINVPFTFPPDRVNGNMVSGVTGMPGTESEFAYPRPLKAELMREFPGFPPGIDHQALYFNDQEKIEAQTMSSIELTYKIAAYVEKKDPADVTMVVFDDIDRMQHFFWRHIDPAHPRHDPKAAERYGSSIRDAYRLMDSALGRLIENYHRDSSILIYSDHGFAPLYKYVHVNNLLMRHGLLHTKRRSPVKAFLTKGGLTKERLKGWMRRLGLLWVLKHIPMQAKLKYPTSILTQRDIDWSRTKAFYSSFSACSISVNLKGKYDQGIVEEKDCDKVLDEVTRLLDDLKDPDTGKAVVKNVYMNDYFSGRFQENAPNMLIEFHEGYKGHKEIAADRLFSPADRDLSANHELEGIFMAMGDGVRHDPHGLEPASIVDVTPTVLRLLGEPVGEDMDGEVMEDIFEDGRAGEDKPRAHYLLRDVEQSDMAEEDREAVAAKLRSMGYMG